MAETRGHLWQSDAEGEALVMGIIKDIVDKAKDLPPYDPPVLDEMDTYEGYYDVSKLPTGPQAPPYFAYEVGHKGVISCSVWQTPGERDGTVTLDDLAKLDTAIARHFFELAEMAGYVPPQV